MNSTISPNMNLIVPTVGQEAGPTYALDINSSLTLIDQHDHSAGNGVQITPAGLNINSSLSFQSNPALNISYLSLSAAAAPSTALQSISTAPASSINELYYTDSNGVSTQLTSNGTVNVTVSSITGVSYSGSGFVFNQIAGGIANSIPATLDSADHTIRPQVASTTLGVTLLSPNGNGNITLPLQPASTSFLTMDSSGTQSASIAVSGGLTTSNLSASAGILGSQLSASAGILGTQIANGTVTGTNIAAGTVTVGNLATAVQVQSTGSGYSNNSNSTTNIVVATITTIATTTRPLLFSFSGQDVTVTGDAVTFFLTCTTSGVVIATWNVNPLSPSTLGVAEFPAGAFNWAGIVPSAHGTSTYALQARVNNAGPSPSLIQTGPVTMTIVQV